MEKVHTYQCHTHWSPQSANRDLKRYDRTHTVSMSNKADLTLTTDNKHVGTPSLHNPEDLLVASLSSCHMLSYLYLCSMEGIVILSYEDHAEGTMVANAQGGGAFSEVVLKPLCLLEDEKMMEHAKELHHKAHEICYIANSVNFPVHCKPEFKVNN